MKSTQTLRRFLSIACSSLLLAVSSAQAQNTSATWDENNNGNWTEVVRWTGNTAYASGTDNTATLGNFINNNRTITLNADITIGSIFAADTSHNYTIEGGNTLTLDVTSGAPQIDVVSGRTLTISTAVSGNDGLNKTNDGTLVLSGTVGYTGATTITAGTLQYSGSSNLTWDAIDGAGSLALDAGSGTILTVTGANTYGGATTVNKGTLNLGGGGATGSLDSTILNLGGGALNYTRTGGTTQNFTTTNLVAGLASSVSAVSAVSGNTLNLGTIVNKGGSIDFGSTGAGTLAADTASNIGGIISGATFNGTNWAVATGTTTAITAYGGSFTTTTSAGNTAANYSAQNMSVDSSQTLGGAITTNSLRFNTAGANTLTLTGTNTVSSGGIMVNGTVGDNASLITGGTLRGSSNGSLYVVQNNTSGSNSALTINSIIANNGTSGLHKAGAGTLVLAASNTYTGVTAISGGTLEIGGSGRLGNGAYAGAIAIASGSTLNYNSSATQTLSGVLSGDGGLTVSDGVLLINNSNNSYTGKTLVTGGVLQIGTSWSGGSDAIPGGINPGVGGSNLEINGGNVRISYVFKRTLGAGAGQFQITGGTSGFSHTQPDTYGRLFINNDVNYEVVWGSDYFKPDVLVLSEAAAAPNQVVNFQNKLDLNGATRTVATNSTTAADPTRVDANNGFMATTGGRFTGVIRNSDTGNAAGIIKTGVGVLQLAAANTYDGGTTVNQGTLQMYGSGTLGASSGALTVNTGGSLDLNDISQSVGNLTGTGGTIANNGSAARTLTIGTGDGTGGNYQGDIVNNTNAGTGTLALTKTGSGTITLSGTNTYTGTTTVSQGSLIINGAVASTSMVVNGSLGGSGVMANATLSGSGSINPGNSPGILTAAATDPSGGLDYNFEFTAGNTLPTWGNAAASVNDVLRLTSATPFTTALGSSNLLNVYFNVGSILDGDVFTGGFYTDTNSDFLSNISGATFQYFLADVGGAVTYNGITYSAYLGGVDVATVLQTANFGAGDINGYTSQFTVAIPEPRAALLGGIGMLLLLRRRRN